MTKYNIKTVVDKMQTKYKYQKLFNDHQIHKNYSKLCKFVYTQFQSLDQIEDGIFEYQNSGEIMIIDKYETKNNKYFILCFDYKIIIIKENDQKGEDEIILQNILAKHSKFNKYFIPNNNDTKSKSYEEKLFLNKITKFNIFLNQILIYNSKNRIIWKIITRCISAFLIKKGLENAYQAHVNHYNEQFKEHKEKIINLQNNSCANLKLFEKGSGGTVNLIYHFPTETIYIRKIPNMSKLGERERDNYLLFESQKERYPFIPQYYGYIEDECYKQLLIEYIEGQTLDIYKINTLSLEEKYDILFELLLTNTLSSLFRIRLQRFKIEQHHHKSQ